MLPVQITRRRDTRVDPKETLRAHVHQLPVDQQREFVAAAFQLITDRMNHQKHGKRAGHLQFLPETQQ